MVITPDHLIRFLQRLDEEVAANRDELTRLDAAIGDADHGTNLHRGFTAVMEKTPSFAGKDIGSILKTTGMTLISTVGGASGPLFGTGFMRAGIALAEQNEAGVDALARAAAAALEGIQARGKAQRGEKTMVDALAPAVEALEQASARGDDLLPALRAAVSAAEQGMQATTPMLATKGRASYLAERSVGHQDPGATSAHLMLRVLLEVIESDQV